MQDLTTITRVSADTIDGRVNYSIGYANGDFSVGSMREDAYALWANAGWPFDAASVRGLMWSAEDDENAEIIVRPPFVGLRGPVDEPAYIEVCAARGWACQIVGPAASALRILGGTTGEKRIAGAATFEDQRRLTWARAAGLA